MDATTTRPTSGRTILAALALALLAALVVGQAAGAVGATTATINKPRRPQGDLRLRRRHG